MPNWCYNELTVSGGTETLKQFLDACMGLPARYPPVILENGQTLFGPPEYTEKRFCFNALIPTPDEVLAIGYDAHAKVSFEDMANVLLGK